MDTTRPATFAKLLRRYRLASGLTQEALAERARLSREAVSALERGERQYPRADTVELLTEALELGDEEREALLGAAARPRRPRQPSSTGSPAPGAAAAPTIQDAPLLPWSHLPAPLTPLLGRAEELERACDLLVHDGVRLLTLTGPAGVGKTRLALEVAAACRDQFSDGAVFAPLASLAEPGLLAETLAHATATPAEGNRRIDEALAAHLRNRQLLLTLDNFEHLLPAAPLLADLLATCPRLAVLVTSRAILHVRGERALPVSPLPVPDPDTSLSDEALAATPAVALFV
ncbi:MAG: helix-turn-helix domain-containing protein, partial [Chloroflexi bacterium]|nr:helix-turn-helix domain-containing protein [Chloroflexota bacterium]